MVALALLCGLGIGLAVGSARPPLVEQHLPAAPLNGVSARDDEPNGLAIVRQGWGMIQQDALDRSALDDRRLTYGAMRGLVQALGDP